MKHPIVRIISFIRKEIKSFVKDKPRVFIFFGMPLLIIITIKFSQNVFFFTQTIGIIDNDSSMGYRFNDSFNYITEIELQNEWEYNESRNTFLNVTKGRVDFTSSNALQRESLYFQRAFNKISDTHNELLISKFNVWIANATLTGFSTSLGMMLDDNFISACGISFSYGNFTVINGSSTEIVCPVENNSLYQIELDIFLKNNSYLLMINGTSEGIFNFALDVSFFYSFQSSIYPSRSPFDSVNVFLDDVNITVNSTPKIDLSDNLTDYIREECEIVHYESDTAAHEDLLTRTIEAFIVIPDGFETNITQDLPIVLNITTDGTNRHDVPEIIESINTAITKFREENEYLLDFIVTDIKSDFVGGINAGPVWMGLLIPPVLAITLVASSMITTCECIVDDTPLQRLLLSPLKRTEILIAKFGAYLFFSILQILVLLAIWLVVLPMIGWNQIIAGSVMDCFLLMLATSIVGISFGLGISAAAKTKAQANQGFITVFVLLLVIWILRISSIDPLTLSEIGFTVLIFKELTIFKIANELFLLLLYSGLALAATFILFSRKKGLV